MTLDIRLLDLDVETDFHIPPKTRNESRIPHELPPTISIRHEKRLRSVILYNSTGSAWLRLPASGKTDSLVGWGWARSPKIWKIFMNTLTPILADNYGVSRHPSYYVRSVTCECQLANHGSRLKLGNFKPILDQLNFTINKSTPNELSFEVGRATVSLDCQGKVRFKGFSSRAQIYSIVQLLDDVRLALRWQSYFEGEGKSVGIYAGVKFSIEYKQIPIDTICPTQCDVDFRGVKYYRELLMEGAYLRIILYRAQVGPKIRHVLLNGHHRARACFEDGWNYVNAIVLNPSEIVESRSAIETIREGVSSIADLRYR